MKSHTCSTPDPQSSILCLWPLLVFPRLQRTDSRHQQRLIPIHIMFWDTLGDQLCSNTRRHPHISLGPRKSSMSHEWLPARDVVSRCITLPSRSDHPTYYCHSICHFSYSGPLSLKLPFSSISTVHANLRVRHDHLIPCTVSSYLFMTLEVSAYLSDDEDERDCITEQSERPERGFIVKGIAL